MLARRNRAQDMPETFHKKNNWKHSHERQER